MGQLVAFESDGELAQNDIDNDVAQSLFVMTD